MQEEHRPCLPRWMKPLQELEVCESVIFFDFHEACHGRRSCHHTYPFEADHFCLYLYLCPCLCSLVKLGHHGESSPYRGHDDRLSYSDTVACSYSSARVTCHMSSSGTAYVAWERVNVSGHQPYFVVARSPISKISEANRRTNSRIFPIDDLTTAH
jgi:hypothetical protein